MDEKDQVRLEKIRRDCPLCDGGGYAEIPHADSIVLEECNCIKQINRELKLIESNIPMKLREWSFDQLTDEFKSKNRKAFGIIQDYLSALDQNISNGVGVWFHSPPGVAKSAIMCTILKNALEDKKRVYIERASHIISLKFGEMRNDNAAKETINYMLSADIIAIEEIEKCYMGGATDKMNNPIPSNNSLMSSLFYEFLSDAYDSNIAILVSSNVLREEQEVLFPPFIRDRLKSLINVPLRGFSGRKDYRNSAGK